MAVAWGDSLTNGYAPILSGLLIQGASNFGIPGETSTQIKNRLLAQVGTVYMGLPTIIWAGRNDIVDPTTVKANIAAMVAALATSNYLVVAIPPSQSAGEANNGANYARLVTLNSDLAAAYPGKFFDVKTFLQGHGDGGANDNADIALDLIPRSLHPAGDDLHFNASGYTLTAQQIKTLMSLV